MVNCRNLSCIVQAAAGRMTVLLATFMTRNMLFKVSQHDFGSFCSCSSQGCGGCQHNDDTDAGAGLVETGPGHFAFLQVCS